MTATGITWVRRRLSAVEKARRTLGDASCDAAYLRIACRSCGHAVAKLPHTIPKWPTGLITELAKALACSKCSAKNISVEEVAWCEEASEIIGGASHAQGNA